MIRAQAMCTTPIATQMDQAIHMATMRKPAANGEATATVVATRAAQMPTATPGTTTATPLPISTMAPGKCAQVVGTRVSATNGSTL